MTHYPDLDEDHGQPPGPLADAFEQMDRIEISVMTAVASGDPSAVLAALAPLGNAVLDLQVAARDARNDAADRLAATAAEGGQS